MRFKFIHAIVFLSLIFFAGCNTVNVNANSGASVACGDVTGLAPMRVNVWAWHSWFGNGKTITVSKDGYITKTLKITSNTPPVLVVELERKFNVFANEEGADVYVNGVHRGKTPLKGVLINDSGDAVLSVKKKGWNEAKMTPVPETPVDINLVMKRVGSGN